MQDVFRINDSKMNLIMLYSFTYHCSNIPVIKVALVGVVAMVTIYAYCFDRIRSRPYRQIQNACRCKKTNLFVEFFVSGPKQTSVIHPHNDGYSENKIRNGNCFDNINR